MQSFFKYAISHQNVDTMHIDMWFQTVTYYPMGIKSVIFMIVVLNVFVNSNDSTKRTVSNDEMMMISYCIGSEVFEKVENLSSESSNDDTTIFVGTPARF